MKKMEIIRNAKSNLQKDTMKTYEKTKNNWFIVGYKVLFH